MGHVVIMPEELRIIRAAEAQNAGKLGGLKVVTCDIGDLRVNGSDREQIDTLVKIIRENSCFIFADMLYCFYEEIRRTF